MRLKTKRAARRRLAFYRAAYHFKPPFRVIVDGTALQTSLNLNVALGDELPSLLGGRAHMLVPKAVVRELEALGKQYEGAAKIARRLKQLPSVGGSAAEAVLSLVGEGNESKYCVLTEDRALQREVARMPGVPLIRFAREKLIVASPAERTVASPVTVTVASPVTVEVAATEATHPPASRPDPLTRRRRGPKQPNPLSVKRKKPKPAMASGRASAEPGVPKEADGGKRRRRHGPRRQ
ncbi:hypothetical protein AB1Y20_006438 [Prymnesium parvum]|uniref:UTP23 sensor motif region domain-containing protein n=1 Tax=Prymnesium parvum TaxID=97485 RepID=A0AB34IYT8_PRYPA